MNGVGAKATLLALDAGVRETGWAVFGPPATQAVPATGIIKAPSPRKTDVPTRLAHLIQRLDLLVDEWAPALVVHSLPSGIHWPVPSLELLEEALDSWSNRHNLPLQAYTAQQVRSAITAKPNASRDPLAFAVMERLGLIGLSKTSHEWEALAAGEYHRIHADLTPDRPPLDDLST